MLNLTIWTTTHSGRNAQSDVLWGRGIFQNGIFQNHSFPQNRNLSEWNLSERNPSEGNLSFRKYFKTQLEYFRMESIRRNLSENIFSKTGIFQNGIFLKESFRNHFLIPLESFRRNLSELFLQNRNHSKWNLSEGIFQKIYFGKTGIFQNGIFLKESFRNHFLIPLESFRRNLSEWNLSELFLQNRNHSEWNLSEGIFQKPLFDPTGIFQKESFRMESFRIVSAKPESFRMESFGRNLSEKIF
jgi:hypothetical protein